MENVYNRVNNKLRNQTFYKVLIYLQWKIREKVCIQIQIQIEDQIQNNIYLQTYDQININKG
jgi:hypothetical protein